MYTSLRYDSLQEAVEFAEDMDKIIESEQFTFEYVSIDNKQHIDDEDYFREHSKCSIM